MTAKLLVVDDEENVRISLQGILQDEGYTVDSVYSGETCLEELERKKYDVVFLDVWLPGKDGIEVLKELRSRRPGQYVIMISGHGTVETAVQATKLGAFDFIEKPLSLEKVVLVLEHALRQKRLEEENRTLKDFIRQETVMIGSSVPMKALRQQTEYAAPTEGRILIYGENGTGKELVAKLLHLNSRRKDQPFIEVNCAAIPDDLIESELFGSVKGAYTGATESRKGKFELADQGTLFLDEVGDMSLKTQAKVLRVLEEQRFYPVGSNEAIEVDVRVIAATNKDLEQEIEKANFRQDLFFRLNVIPFEVPPLRDRKEDIPELVEYFMEDFCQRYGKRKKRIQTEAMSKLQCYQWPGNVRELKNTIERLAIMVPGQEVTLFDLPSSILKQSQGARERNLQKWQGAREEFERQFILEKLVENEGNVSRTAAAIGMERTHLHRKLKAYNIKLK
ncbi:sigma-54 dependent transcriptional regulator [Acidobacteria bacterium AH-259-G07]|nr:sigma-54 dependent transcriptional regulator [Acidobacteria bacterium AH-259-G07]